MRSRRYSPSRTTVHIFLAALLACLAAPGATAQVTQEAYVKASNTGSSDAFGTSGALDGNTLVVGAKEEESTATGVNGDGSNNDASDSGAAYVYIKKESGDWVLEAYLKASNTGPEDEFGTAVAISGDTIVVGAPEEASNATGINGDQADNSLSRAGAVYVYVRTGTTWTQQAYIKANDTSAQSRFGHSVAIDGDWMVVGAWGNDSGTGAAYVYRRAGTTWSFIQKLTASNKAFSDYFGWSVAIDGDQIAVGARQEASASTGVNGDQANNDAFQSGAVYLFTRDVFSWTQQAYFKSSNPGNPMGSFGVRAGQAFGWSLDISGGTLAVGAPFEASTSTGIDGDPNATDAQQSGAVYIFEGSGASWAQTAYLKASNAQAFDEFGRSVALAGGTLAVGAHTEGSGDAGPGANQADNSQPGAGAVYVFERDDATGDWMQSAYLKASNPLNFDQFGGSVALGGGLLAAGAVGEDSDAINIDGDENNDNASGAGATYVFGPFDTSTFKINAGVNDAWVSEDAPFQGFFFTVFDTLQLMFLSWFTFDSVAPDGSVTATFGAPDQRWVTASGTINGDTATLNVELTSGGIFNSDDKVAEQDTSYGTITIKFLNCNEAIVTYNIPSLGLSGSFTATRVVPSNVGLCEAMQ